MTSDPVEPRHERRAGVSIALDRGPRAHERLGGRVVGVSAQVEAREPVHGRVVCAVELAERFTVTFLCPAHQSAIEGSNVGEGRLTVPIGDRGGNVRGDLGQPEPGDVRVFSHDSYQSAAAGPGMSDARELP